MVFCLENSTDLCYEVKLRLLKHPLKTQEALAEEVQKKTGLKVDGAYISNILAGRRNAPKVVQAICEILGITNASTS